MTPIKRYEGNLQASGLKFGIVVSRFNNFLTDKLVEGALDCIKRHGGSEESIEIAYVPGSFEIPYAAQKMVQSERYHAVVCLGALIRGHTPHFDYIASESAKGISRMALESGLPVIYGLITADTLEQAIERAGTKAGNKGWQAAEAAIEMANLYRSMQ